MISLNNVHKSYVTGSNSLHVLKGIDLKIEQGEFVSINGFFGFGEVHVVEYPWNFGQLRRRRVLPERETGEKHE